MKKFKTSSGGLDPAKSRKLRNQPGDAPLDTALACTEAGGHKVSVANGTQVFREDLFCLR